MIYRECLKAALTKSRSLSYSKTISLLCCPAFWMAFIVFLSFPLQSCDAKTSNKYPLGKAYYREASLKNDMKQLARNYGDFVDMHTIGITSQQKKPIYALQIQTGINRIPVLIIGQHHGEEVVGVEIAMDLAKYLTNFKNDSSISRLLEIYSFWIIPTLNPEGFAIVTSGKSEWKRKNGTDTNKNGKHDIKTDGVDLNRNYPTFWKLDMPQPHSSFYYKGTAPASENEIKAINELAALHLFKYAFFYHSSVSGTYSEKIYLPWQDMQDNLRKQDFAEMRDITDYYASLVPRDYTDGTYSVHSGNTSKIGNARNHFYYEYGTYAFDIEVCGVNRFGIGIVHPNPDMKAKIVKKNVSAILHTLAYLIE